MRTFSNAGREVDRMRILEVQIYRFGALANQKFTFSDGFHIICQNNGFGKSTLLGFIKAMFYGFFEGHKKSLEENDRKKFLPWDGGKCGGSLTFEVQGEEYTIERTFGLTPKTDTLTVRDNRLGVVTEKFGKIPGESIFGIDAEGFLRTLALSERTFAEGANESVSGRLSSMVGTGGDIDGLEGAVKLIDAQRSDITKNSKKGRLDVIKIKMSEVENEIRILNEKAGQIAFFTEGIARLEEKKKSLTEEKERLETELAEDTSLGEEMLRKKRLEDALTQIALLTKKLGDTVPSEEQIEEMQHAEGRYPEEETALYQRLAPIFKTFSEMELREKRHQANLLQGETVERSFDFYAEYPYMKGLEDVEGGDLLKVPKYLLRQRVLIAGIALMALGVIALLVGFFVSALLPFALLAIVGGVVAVLARPKTTLPKEKFERIQKALKEGGHSGVEALGTLLEKREFAKALTEKEKARVENETSLHAYLSRYGYDDAELLTGLERLEEDFRRYLSLTERHFERAEQTNRRLKEFKARYIAFGESPYTGLREAVYMLKKLREEKSALEVEAQNPKQSMREEKSARLKEVRVELNSIDANLLRLQQRLSDAEDALESAVEKMAEKEELEEQRRAIEYRLNILKKAGEKLDCAKVRMQSSYLIPTKKRFNEILTTLTEKEAGTLNLDNDFRLTYIQGGLSREMEAMSRGERDLYLLIERLAVVDTLYPEGMAPPIFLDDPFVAFDDTRVAKALEYLRLLGEKRQIVYLTCSKARV